MGRRFLHMAIVSCVFGLIGANSAIALNETTHAIINEQAARQSRPNKPGLDQVLKDQLGFPKGIEEVVHGRQVLRWLGEGGIQEDSPLCRTARHFHDPLQPWENAGLRTLNPIIVVPCGGSSFLSSVHWAQEPNQSVGEKGSWQDARRHYLRALTALDPVTRERAFADTFQTIGQQMHLVVDTSVTEHVRNDPHLLESVLRAVGQRGHGSYEHWVSDQHGPPGSSKEQNFITTYLSNPINFDALILQQPTNDSNAPVPIARLIDTNTYTGLASGPNVTKDNPAIGIAEFANANFFSEHTQPGQYPFPDINSLVPSEHPAPKTGRARAYYKKGSQDGVQVDPVLVECVLDEVALAEGILDPFVYTCTDENVWAQTAEAMLPRAVSYARGVLDYFFRGTLDFTVSASSTSPNQNELTMTNTSAETMDGTFTLYADNAAGERDLVFPFDLTLEPGATSGPLSFSFPIALEQTFFLVFEGQLGNEKGAVVGKIKKTKKARLVLVTTGPIANAEWIISGIAPITITMKYKSVDHMDIRTTALDILGRVNVASSSPDAAGRGRVMLTGTVPDFTDVTVSLKPPIPPQSAQTSVIMGVALNNGFLCISQISKGGLRAGLFPNKFSRGFKFAPCPE